MVNAENIAPQQFQESEEKDSSISMKDLFRICIANWYWFIISVVLFLCAGYYYTLKTEPVYTRSASLLCRDDMKGTGAYNVSGIFNSFGIPTSRSDVYNEIFVIKSPIIMESVVKKLKLNVDYRREGFFRSSTLYGSEIPFIVEFPDNPEKSISLRMNLKNGRHEITGIKEYTPGGIVEYDKPITFNPQAIDSISTPAGKIIVRPNADYRSGSDKGPDMIMDVTYRPMYTAVERLIAAISSSQPEEHASIIDVELQETSPVRANDILNTLIEVYNNKWIEDRNEIARATSQFIDERLVVIEQELGTVDGNISDFKAKNLIPDIEAVSSMYLNRSEKNSQAILELNTQREMAKYIKDFLNNPQYGLSVLPANTGIGSTSIESQIAEYNKTVLEYKNLLGNSSDRNPLVKELGSSLKESRKAIIESVDNLIVSLDTKIGSLSRNERETNSKLSGAPGHTKYLISIERRQKVLEALYLYLLQKREENEVGKVFTPSNVRIISYARGSNIPVSPKKTNILLISFLAGLFVPFGIIFLYENLNNTVRSRADLDRLNLPYLGDIPTYGKLRHRWERVLRLDRGDKEIGYIVGEGKTDAINEAFRILRSNVSYYIRSNSEMKNGECNVIMVTSAIPHSGKTFITENLGSAYAIKGKRVLMIDLDLRRHALSTTTLEKENHNGMSRLLINGNEGIAASITKGVNGIENLCILPSGPVPPNPTELLENGKLSEIIAALRNDYDIILIDCPPINVVSDTQAIATIADMTIFVVRVGNLSREYLPDITNLYKSGKYPRMTLVLNGTNVKVVAGYSYSYGYQ